MVLLLLFGFVIQGATEEIVFRGWMLPILSTRYSLIVSVLVTSTGFGVYHLKIPGISILSFINLVLFGVFAALYVLNEGSLWGLCGLHSIWNWIQGSVYGIKVSGESLPGGSIISMEPVQNKVLFSRGAFGLEGSLIVSIVLSIACIYLYKKIKEKMYLEK
jgi:membrane protease YdiL (CAAX protease family)